VLESAGIPGILVLVWISLLMAVMRQLAGPMIRKLAPTGILALSAVLAGLGLVWLSYATGLVTALAAGSVFALGVAYFWPTMIGITSERVPKGGALALAIMGAVGMLSVGLITTPMMGRIADRYLQEQLPDDQTRKCLGQISAEFSKLASQASGQTGRDMGQAADAARDILDRKYPTLPAGPTAEALRLAIAAAPKAEAAQQAKELFRPAENYGGRMAFRYVATLAVALIAIFGLLHVSDRLRRA
jgi:hypothetical protein